MPRCFSLTQIVMILLALGVLNACRTTPVPPMAPAAKAPAAPVAATASPAPVSTQAPAPKLPSVALLDFESATLPPSETIAVSQALWAQLRRPAEIALLPRDETRRWLIANDLYPYMPLQKEIPLGRVVEALRVDYLFTGRIERAGKGYVVNMTLTGRDGLPVLQNSMDVSGGPAELTRAVERIAPVFRKTIIGASKPAASRPAKLAGDKKMKTRVSSAPVQERDVEKITADQRKPAIVAAANTDAAAVKPAATPTPTPTPTPTATPTATPTPKHTPRPTPTATPTPAPTPTPAATTIVLRASSSPKPETVIPTPKPTEAPAAVATDPVGRARALQKEANQLAPRNERRLELLKQAAALAPGDVQVLRGLANEYYLRENFGQCVEIYSKALKLDPNNSMLLTFRGSAQYCQDRLAEASADFARAVEIDPNNHFARYNLALSAHMRKSPDAAKLWREYLAKSEGAADQDEQRKEAKHYLATLGK